VVLKPQGPLERPPHGRLVVHYQYARHSPYDRAYS